MDIVDGGADLLGLADQRVTLVGEILDQAADADFVVAVSAGKRRDFVLYQRFKFAGARQCALDAVAHSRDFAPDRLADIDDESRATASGSESRMATPAMDCAISRNSWLRQAMWATPKKKIIGNKEAAPRPIITAVGEWPGAKGGAEFRQKGPR